MSEAEILDQDNIGLGWPWAGVALVLIYLGALVASLESPPLGLVVGAVAAAAIVYQLTSRTDVDLGYIPVGSAGLAVLSAGLHFADEPAVFLFGTVFCGTLACLPAAILGQKRAAPGVPGWVANLGGGLICLCGIAALLVTRGRLVDWPPLSTISLVGIPLFAALACYSFSQLISHVFMLVGRFVLRVVYRITFEGVEKIPAEGGFLTCSNHVSYIDWLIIGIALQRPYRMVGDHVYVSDGLLRWVFLGAGGIPIASAREDEALLKEGFRKISEALAQGHAVGLHPEGYMTRTGYLQPIRPGVERIVAQSSVSVVPAFIDGMYGSLLSRKYGRSLGKADWSFRRRVSVRFGEPISPEGFSKELLEEKLVEAGAIRESDLGLESRSKHVNVTPTDGPTQSPPSEEAEAP